MLVIHDPKVAAYSERVLFMRDGQIVNEVQLGNFDENDMENRLEKITTEMLELEI